MTDEVVGMHGVCKLAVTECAKNCQFGGKLCI